MDITHWTVRKTLERFNNYTSPLSLPFKFSNTESCFSARKETLYDYPSLYKWITVGKVK